LLEAEVAEKRSPEAGIGSPHVRSLVAQDTEMKLKDQSRLIDQIQPQMKLKDHSR
jgi:hypothetical protein